MSVSALTTVSPHSLLVAEPAVERFQLLGVLERQNDVALEATARGSAERATSMMSE
jgi:hypothetical protein